MKATNEHISHEAGDDDAWVCICGNTPPGDGFYPCDENGDEMTPSVGSNWNNLYVCARCGRIINQETLHVLGQNKNSKLLP